jgi:transposase
LQLLWEEYCAAAVTGGTVATPYKYSQFCELYRAWRRRLSPTMRQVHQAGEKAFLDYSGKKPHVVDPATGEVQEVELFVMVLGASSYAYAEATVSQSIADFIGSTTRGLEYFGCVPALLVPDQLRSAVRGPDRYDPIINDTYFDFASYYGLSVMPARPRKPRDKATVEAAVQLVQRWILTRLRHMTFFSLGGESVAERERLGVPRHPFAACHPPETPTRREYLPFGSTRTSVVTTRRRACRRAR